MFGSQKFYLTLENFSETVKKIEEALSKEKITKKESVNAQLLLEETFMRLVNIGKAEGAQVTISKRFGDLNLTLESTGEEYNPLIYVTDFDEDDEDYFRTMILKANSYKMSYVRKPLKNIVIINVHESNNKQLKYTLIGLVAGIIFGVVLKFSSVPPEFMEFFQSTLAGSFQTMFMNALNMIIAPVIFFSVINGIIGLSDTATAGRIGGKLIGLYSFTTVIAASISLFLASIFFSSGVPQVGIVEGEVSTAEISILNTIINVIPANLITPIVERNLLQVIFAAVLFGMCINMLGDKVKSLKDFIRSVNDLCITVITLIVKLIPLLTFFSLANMIINLGIDSIILLGKLLLVILLCEFLMVMTYSTILKIFGGLSPVPFLKKLPSFVPIPFATSSSNVTMPFTMKFCTEKLGVSPKMASFSIPLGATINMDGTTIFYGMACSMIMKMYGIEIDANAIFILLVSIYTISVGTPGIPGGAVVLMAAILGNFGIPAEAVTIVVGIYPIEDRFSTTTNILGDIAATITLAKTENLLDENIYYKM